MSRPPKLSRKFVRNWQPTWQPEYEAIVAESCLGKSNVALAEKYNFTPQHISNILNTEEARRIKREAIAAIRNASLSILEGKMAESAARAVENIHKVMHNDELLLNNPLAVMEKSLAVLKGLGKLQGDGTVINNNVNNIKADNAIINLGEEQQKTFMDGMEKALEAIEMHKQLSGDSIK